MKRKKQPNNELDQSSHQDEKMRLKKKRKNTALVIDSDTVESASSDVVSGTTTDDNEEATKKDNVEKKVVKTDIKSSKKKKKKNDIEEENCVTEEIAVENAVLASNESSEVDEVRKILNFGDIDDTRLSDQKEKKRKKRGSLPGKKALTTLEVDSNVKKSRKSLPASLSKTSAIEPAEEDKQEETSSSSEIITKVMKGNKSKVKQREEPVLNLVDESVQEQVAVASKKKKKKGLTTEDEPKPFVEFLSDQTPRAFARKSRVQSEPRLSKKQNGKSKEDVSFLFFF